MTPAKKPAATRRVARAVASSLSDADIAAIASALALATAPKAAAMAAAEVLATAEATRSTAAEKRDSGDHDEFVRLQVQVATIIRDIATMKTDVLDAVKRVDEKASSIDGRVAIQNGRTSKLETRWIQGAAVIAFLLVVLPLALAAVSIYQK